jgi:hypothetical protein
MIVSSFPNALTSHLLTVLADVKAYVCHVTLLGSTLIKNFNEGMLSVSGC